MDSSAFERIFGVLRSRIPPQVRRQTGLRILETALTEGVTVQNSIANVLNSGLLNDIDNLPDFEKTLYESTVLMVASHLKLSPDFAVPESVAEAMQGLGLARPAKVISDEEYQITATSGGQCQCVLCCFRRTYGLDNESDDAALSALSEDVKFVHPEPSAKQ